jgi:hypothetical protein
MTDEERFQCVFALMAWREASDREAFFGWDAETRMRCIQGNPSLVRTVAEVVAFLTADPAEYVGDLRRAREGEGT